MDREYLEKIARLLDADKLSLSELREIKAQLENEDHTPEAKELILKISKKI